ncbi:ABC transporter permease [Gordonia amicalis]|uniref:ABC transporter permease n=1 Tax=Gordonia amicalis TaxID=89053 RepID=A0ABU4DJ96_9ACTN|nr:ABC transporter permease [Gordonia amicalis]MDV6309824.1 ABC transporter permease [Gordonia amicalis]MDV7100308.1 ABC transporter permease [Gordonia amicalis]
MATPAPAHTDDAPPVEDAAALEAARQARKEKIGRIGFAFVFPFLMVVMMITGYLGAMHDPRPNDMPIVVAGPAAAVEQFASALENADPDAVDIRLVDSADTARAMVIDREASGAVVLPAASPDEKAATVYTAGFRGCLSGEHGPGPGDAAAPGRRPADTSAGSGPVARRGFGGSGPDVPDHRADPGRLHAAEPGAILRARIVASASHGPDSGGVVGVAALLGWIIAGPVLGVAQGSVWQVLGIAWLTVFAVGSVQLFLTRILGPLAVLAGMLFLMVLGIPASNMGMSVHTMPGIFSWLHGFLPTAAAGEAFRSVMYFGGNGVGGHLLVLVTGAVLGLAAVAGIDALKRRRNTYEEPVQSVISMTGGATAPKTWVRYATLVFFPLAMVAMMLSAMLGGMGKPIPREMPVAVVGSTPEQAQLTAAGLDQNMSGMFDFSVGTSTADAATMVRDREVVAAFVLPSAENPSATLLTNGAAGMSQQQAVQSVFGQVAQGQGMTLGVDDLAPLDSDDSVGTVSLYLAIGWIMSGFLLLIVLAMAAPDLMRKRVLVPIMAGWSVFMSAVLWVIAGPIVGAIDGHFLPLFGVGVVAIFSAAMFTTVFTRMIGLLAVLPVVAVLMFLGVPSSGGGLSVYMAPDVFRFLHDVLPLPAAVESARSILYFGGDAIGSQLLTFAIWAAVSFIVVLVLDTFFARPPQPIPGRAVPPGVADDGGPVADAAEPASASPAGRT